MNCFLSKEGFITQQFNDAFVRKIGHREKKKGCSHKNWKAVHIESKAVAVTDSNEKVKWFVDVDRDVAEKKAMAKRLLVSERFAARGQISAMVAHDLRKTLQSISTAAYYLNKKSRRQKTTKLLQCIEEAVKYANKITRDILDYSANLKLELLKTDPCSIINQALSSVTVAENIQVINEANHEPPIYVDKDKIKRVCVNLIINVFDAMPDGGTLTVASEEANDDLVLSFADTGIGMSKENLEIRWTKLFTTKDKGMGLGLPICKKIIEAHKGSIRAKSTIGKGTTFTVRIPLNLQEQKN